MPSRRVYDRVTVIDYDGHGSVIDGWIDDKTHAVISWRGFDPDGSSEVYRRVVKSQRVTMQMLSAIESYVNLKLISARIETEKEDENN
jgi:hypothetical protein